MAACRRPHFRLAVGAHPVRDALAPFGAIDFRAKSFRPPSEGELLSLACPRESNQREGHPAYAPCGHPARKVRGRFTGFVDSTSCADAKLAGILAGHPAGFPTPARRFRGAPGRTAGHPGPVELASESNSNQSEVLGCCCSAVDLAVDLAFLESAGPDGPLFCPGPLCGGEAGTIGRAAGTDRDGGSFSHGQDARSKSPAPAHALAGQEPGKRQAGWPSLWLLSLTPGVLPYALRAGSAVRARSKRARGHARESDSSSVGGRKLFALRRNDATKSSRLKSLSQAHKPC